MPTKKTFAIVAIDQKLAASLVADMAQEKEYPVYKDERPDIRCDKCGAPVEDDGRYHPELYEHDDWD